MDKKKAALIIHEYGVNGSSYRTLGKKYGMSRSTVYRIVMSKKEKQVKSNEPEVPEETLADDVKVLKEAIRKLRLKVELQDIIIDITSKELGVDIRKKPGTRQS